MPHYKDPVNKVHWLDDPALEHVLPAGSVQITDEEADQLRPQVGPTKADRISSKLQAGGFPSKGHLYYFIENMRTVAALKLGITDAQAHAAGYAGNPMYKQMVDLYNEILAIEAEP